MKNIKIYLIGQKFDIEVEDKFYEYIHNDIIKLNNSKNQIKDLLNLLLLSKNELFKIDKNLNSLLEKL